MDRYAVIGNPIAHSLSPRIHTLFAKQLAQAMTYEALLAPKDDFAATVERFIQAGGRGLNVTLPFKGEAHTLADRLSDRANQAQAVNTLQQSETGVLYGDNTDGIGLLRDLRDHLGVEPASRDILILGAGGAVRGILPVLLQQPPQRLVIANRTVAKAAELAQDFGSLATVEACGFANLAGERFDLIINGTAASLADELPPLPGNLLMPHALCYDMVYAATPTAFLRWAQTQGAAQASDGLGMLIEQAAESFRLWRGLFPDTSEVRRQLRPTSR